MLAEFSIVPLGKGESVSDLVAKAAEIVHKSGLEYRLNPRGTEFFALHFLKNML